LNGLIIAVINFTVNSSVIGMGLLTILETWM